MNQTRHIILAIILIGVCTNTKAQPNEITYLDPEKFQIQYKSDTNAIMVDVSSEIKYNSSRIQGAIGIHRGRKVEYFADTIDRETPIYIYCDGESRSLTVAKYLQYRGFRDVIILRGGTKQWKSAGLPMEGRRKPSFFWQKTQRKQGSGHL